MSATDDAQAMVDSAEALHTSLSQAWLAAMNAGDFDKAKDLKAQADKAGDELINANQYLLDAIDSGQDVTDLLAQITSVANDIKAAQQAVTDGTASMND